MTRAQLAQAARDEQAALQLKRDEAQFEIGGIARAQLDDCGANHAIKAARVRELAGQLEVSRLPARDEQIRAQDAQVAAARAASSQATWRLDQKRVLATQGGLVVDTLYREGEWVAAGSPVVRLLPPQNVKVRFFVPETAAGALTPGRAVALHCDGCDADVAGHGELHLQRARVHAAGHLQQRDARQARVHGRGAAGGRRRAAAASRAAGRR